LYQASSKNNLHEELAGVKAKAGGRVESYYSQRRNIESGSGAGALK